ncbi:hypothetical protein GCM10010191_78450 [Actinomadura vinacea]|uniref:NADH:quinone oxidoreductase/Mrp antiporter membrane subunit domain-containing protein n=1 Tax=Actinomadura vinacea TaxID=115336 RepID=A0ABN3K5N8_9ACTN
MKGALFLAAGALLNRHETVDEHDLRGRGRGMPVANATFLLGALILAGLPPSGLWAMHAITEHAAGRLGWWWFTPVAVTASALTASAVLRVWLRVFRDAPAGDGRTHDHEDPETRTPLRSLPWTMSAPGAVLLAAALVLGLLPGGPIAQASAVFTDQAGYAALVLDGQVAHPHATPADPWTLSGLLGPLLSLVLAVLIAVHAVRRPTSGTRPHPVRRAADAAAGRLHALHSGHIGDYAAWLTAGVAVLALLTAGP